ncbi:MAG: hypothetical protein RLN90_09525 [Balneolaceae bacterium]
MSDFQIYILSHVDVVCTMPDNSTKTITLERPNSPDKPYSIIRRVLKRSDDYRDPTFNERNGNRLFELEFQLAYQNHRMDLTPLLVSKSVELKVPSYLYSDSRYYKSYSVRFLNDELEESPKNGLKVAHLKSLLNSSNPSPNEGVVLRFKSKVYTASEFLELLPWFNPKTVQDDSGTPIPGFILTDETGDGLGLKISNYEPAEFTTELTTKIKVGSKYFTIESIIMESNNG